MRNFLIAILLVGLLPSTLSAQIVQIQATSDCRLGKCSIQFGSGVMIGRQTDESRQKTVYHVITVPHVVRGASAVYIVSNTGRIPARVVNINEQAYLMLLSFDMPISAPALKLISIDGGIQPAGSDVLICGYPEREQGRYSQRSLVLKSFSEDMFETTSPFQLGESGGPIVRNGKVVGLCEGYHVRSKIGFGPSGPAIVRFLGYRTEREGTNSPTSPRGSTNGSGVVPAPVPPPPVPMSEVSVPSVPLPTDPMPTTPSKPVEIPSPPNLPPSSTPKPEPDETFVPTPAQPIKGESPPIKKDEGEKRYLPIVSDQPTKKGFGMDLLSLAVGALGVASGGGLVGVGMWLAKRKLAQVATAAVVDRIHHTISPTQQPSLVPSQPVQYTNPIQQPPVIIGTQSPPLPQQVYNTASFVPYETKDFQEAYEFAKLEISKKWPGSIDAQVVMDSLIQQYLTAKRKKT